MPYDISNVHGILTRCENGEMEFLSMNDDYKSLNSNSLNNSISQESVKDQKFKCQLIDILNNLLYTYNIFICIFSLITINSTLYPYNSKILKGKKPADSSISLINHDFAPLIFGLEK